MRRAYRPAKPVTKARCEVYVFGDGLESGVFQIPLDIIKCKLPKAKVANAVAKFVTQKFDFWVDEVETWLYKNQWHARVRGNKKFVPTVRDNCFGTQFYTKETEHVGNRDRGHQIGS